jgi:murein DD-endopeptidase MepM/ murein hydrolase activator NlpD
MIKQTLLLLALLLLTVGCEPTLMQPIATEVTPTRAALVVTAVPTANPLPSVTPSVPPTITPTPTLTFTPSVTPSVTPSPTRTLTPTIAPTTTPIASATPTDPSNDPNFTPPPTWTPPPANPSVQIADHYVFARPIPDYGQNWANRVYAYGSTAGGRLQVHKGVDMENPTGTQILAVADGTVVYAGDDLSNLLGPINNYYGNVVVIQHPIASSEGLPVFSLYGHMDSIRVQSGQAVTRGTQLGTVGGTGVALGPHLHFEVRVGDPFGFDATRNPELWIRPYPTFGTLAGIVRDSAGNRLFDVTINVRSSDISRFAFSYKDTSVNPDPVFNENFVLGDLPANYYEVSVNDNGRVRFQQIIYIYPNRTTWLEIVLN